MMVKGVNKASPKTTVKVTCLGMEYLSIKWLDRLVIPRKIFPSKVLDAVDTEEEEADDDDEASDLPSMDETMDVSVCG